MKFATSYDDFGPMSKASGLSMVVDEKTGELDPGRTQQSFKEECDINEIVRRFGLTGELPENVHVPQSGDFTDVVDYKTAMNAVIEAERGFMELPAKLRRRFGDDPQQLLEFLEDPDNRDEARKLGLLKALPEVTRSAVEAIDDLAGKLVPEDKK